MLIEKFGADKKAAGRAPPQVKSTGSPRLGISPPSRKDRRSRKRIIAGVVGILFLVAAGIVGWHLRSLGSDETRSAPRLSIVVLPFANLSNDPEQDYFADAITEDLTKLRPDLHIKYLTVSHIALSGCR